MTDVVKLCCLHVLQMHVPKDGREVKCLCGYIWTASATVEGWIRKAL